MATHRSNSDQIGLRNMSASDVARRRGGISRLTFAVLDELKDRFRFVGAAARWPIRPPFAVGGNGIRRLRAPICLLGWRAKHSLEIALGFHEYWSCPP